MIYRFGYEELNVFIMLSDSQAYLFRLSEDLYVWLIQQFELKNICPLMSSQVACKPIFQIRWKLFCLPSAGSWWSNGSRSVVTVGELIRSPKRMLRRDRMSAAGPFIWEMGKRCWPFYQLPCAVICLTPSSFLVWGCYLFSNSYSMAYLRIQSLKLPPRWPHKQVWDGNTSALLKYLTVAEMEHQGSPSSFTPVELLARISWDHVPTRCISNHPFEGISRIFQTLLLMFAEEM